MHVVNFYTLFAYSFFRRGFPTAHQVQCCPCIRAYMYMPRKAAQMYFDRIPLEHVLEMINFQHIVQTMIIQVICADLSASSRLYVFRNDAV